MAGLEVIRRLRSDPLALNAYSVILTALSEADIREMNDQAKEMGVDEFIRKPLMPQVVRSLLAKISSRPRALSADV
jgi:CheY-like chemotaxis protein